MKVRTLLPTLALCAMPVLAQGVSAGTTSFGLNIGWTQPQGNYDKLTENGYMGSIDFTYNLSSKLAFRTEFGRASNNVDASHFINASGFDASVYNYNLTENAIYTFNPTADFNVYVIGGLGGARVTSQVGAYSYYGGAWDPWWGYYPVYGYNTAYSETTTRITYNAGLGVQFKISPRFSMSVESRYTWIATKNNIEYVPLAIGFRWM